MLENNFNISIPDEWLDGESKNYFALKVSGNSYAPHYNEGDLLLICKDLSKLEENDIRIYEIYGKYELRRYGLSTNGTELLRGLTDYIPPLTDLDFKLLGFVYMRITNYRQEAANSGSTEE